MIQSHFFNEGIIELLCFFDMFYYDAWVLKIFTVLWTDFVTTFLLPGINVNDHDIRFVEDNWESPVNSFLSHSDCPYLLYYMFFNFMLFCLNSQVN